MPEEDDPWKNKSKLFDDLKTVTLSADEELKPTYDPVFYIADQLIGTYDNFS